MGLNFLDIGQKLTISPNTYYHYIKDQELHCFMPAINNINALISSLSN